MTRIAVVGVGGMAREAAAWAAHAGNEVLGFLTTDPSAVGSMVADLPVLGGDEWLDEHPDVQLVVAVGVPSVRAGAIERLRSRGSALATIVHPTAVVGPRCVIGPGAIICPGVVLTTDATLHEAVIVNFGAVVGHDCVIGDHVFIGPNAALGGNVTLGDRADIGIGANIRQGITVGADAVVGGGAMVIEDVPPGVTVVGVPARPLERS